MRARPYLSGVFLKRIAFPILISLAAAAPSPAQLANQPPVPRWLGGGESSTEFEWSGKLLRAILFVAGDAEAEAILNGQSLGKFMPGDTAASVDVTAKIRPGKNALTVRSSSRMAALLELNGDLTRKQWIATGSGWSSGGKMASPGLPTDSDPAKNPFDFKKTFDAYNSWQLAKPGTQSQATDPATLTVPPGYKVELVRSAQSGEDSWVSMAFDPEGRITLGMEEKGLLRLTVSGGGDQRIEVINDTLKECRGLLYAHGALFANANNSKALYRLRDTNGDGRFDEEKELLRTEGGVGHGRNHIKLGPDGRIWVAHGNNVVLAANVSSDSPFKHYADDQVLPNPWDGSMFDGDVKLPAGHILSVSPDGSDVRVIAGGLRNPLDIAFNHDGELFTFDADMERDVGASWYMPTRVLHIVPGADFGWRRGTGRWPAWYADTLPSVVDIGLSSPTGVFFGYESKFPEADRDALFILDWSYGRIIAVRMRGKGASYEGTQQTFVSGRPLNVTDGCIGPDGAMWFITGGRGTQSGLYRVTWVGLKDFDPPEIPGYFPKHDEAPPKAARERRRKLEEMAKSPAACAENLPAVLQALRDRDPFIRHAARLCVEEVPTARWRREILEETTGRIAIEGCLSLARLGDAAAKDGILSRLSSIASERLDGDEQLALLRALSVTFARLGPPDEKQRQALTAQLDSKFPAEDRHLNWELTRVLIYLHAPSVIAKATELLRGATTSEDLIFYPLHLRYLRDGWTNAQRRVVFEALTRAEKLNGASTYFKAIADTRAEFASALNPEQAQQLADVIAPPKPVQLSPHALPGHTFKVWKLEDLEPQLPKVARGRSFDGAKKALVAAQCVFCHRVGSDPSLPAGIFGPDLTQVAARFGRRDLLDHVLNPSKIIDDKFRFFTVVQKDGKEVTGTLEGEDDERVILKPNPLAADKIEIGRSMIKERRMSDVSPMPAGLLNALKADQILDLLAWFEAGGDPKHKVFQP